MPSKNCKFFFSYLLLSFVFFCLPLFSQDVKAFLKTLSKNDQEALQKLFQRMVNHDHFAYTLFGDKPVSISGDFVLTPIDNILCGMKCGGIFTKNWEVWKKYAAFFPINHYALIEEPIKNDMKGIVLINKNAFLKIVNQHLSLFREFLGREITAVDLLKKIETEQRFISIIKENQLLLGLLLGYGKHNAELFYKRHHLRLFLKSKKFPSIPFKIPSPSKNFDSLQDEFNSFQSKLTPFGDYNYSTLIIQPVHFMADSNHPVTINLRKKYQNLRAKISSIYSQGDFLEVTLNQLIAN